MNLSNVLNLINAEIKKQEYKIVAKNENEFKKEIPRKHYMKISIIS